MSCNVTFEKVTTSLEEAWYFIKRYTTHLGTDIKSSASGDERLLQNLYFHKSNLHCLLNILVLLLFCVCNIVCQKKPRKIVCIVLNI